MNTSIPTRSEVPETLTWDLTSIYPSEDAWEDVFRTVSERLPAFGQVQGSLGQSARQLYDGLVLRDQLGAAIDRLMEYAGRRHYADMTNGSYAALLGRAWTLTASYQEATAFYGSEILGIAPEQLGRFLFEEPALSPYRHHLDVITRLRPHVRSAEIERLLAGFADLSRGPGRIFDALYNVDVAQRLPTMIAANGEPVQLTDSSYFAALRSEDRRERRDAFEGMLGSFRQEGHTLAANLMLQVQSNVFVAHARGYESAMEAALNQAHIPKEVYTTLVQRVGAHLPSFRRYLALRDKALALGDQQHIYDLQAPLIVASDNEVPYDAACAILLDALAPLGSEYTAALEEGFRVRWIDVVESRGKLSGAYCAGAYGTFPFISLNYGSRREDLFTLAHETGHAMHSYFSWCTQPYIYAYAADFICEIAAKVHEELLRAHLLQQATDKADRVAGLGQYLEHFRFSMIRQTLFADFELRIHQRVEAGESLTADALCGIYRELNERYYGDGGVVVDDLISWEWSIVPGFYMSFYVYTYATATAAATAIARRILDEGQSAADRYVRLLRAGSSGYPIDLLKEAGVDMRDV
ncbi:MAG: M3 family oligoendopeptidase, partial [Chloroflexota bacterium]